MKKISEHCWKLSVDSNIYFINTDKNIIIDCGPRTYNKEVKEELSKIVDLNFIDIVIFTHLHHDHIGNFDLFPNAKFYASKTEINELYKNKENVILDKNIEELFNVRLHPLPLKIEEIEVIKTPGHTNGSICLFFIPEKILFTGDTFFRQGVIGRSDLPNSVPNEFDKSLDKLKEIKYDILCPGHDY